MAESIIDGTNIDVNVLSYSGPKPHASGGKVVNLNNKFSNKNLVLSTPLILTWGAQEGKEQSTQKPTGKWTMALQFPSTEYSNPDAEKFLTSLRKLEAKIKADAMVNSMVWFGKEIKSSEVIDEKFNSMLKYPKKTKGGVEVDLTKSPTLTVKLPQWSGVWKPEIYDDDGEPLFISGKTNSHLSPLEFLKPKSQVICLIQCGGIWFINGIVSITWNLKQAMVQKPTPSMEGVCLLKPKAADIKAMKALPPVEPDCNQYDAPTTIVEDSDDEPNDETIRHAPTHVVVSSPPVVVPVTVVVPVVKLVTAVEPAQESIDVDVKPKRRIIRKKTDA